MAPWLLFMACSMSPDPTTAPDRTVDPVLPPGSDGTDTDSGLKPEPDDTGNAFGPLTGTWQGTCEDPPPPPIAIIVPADVDNIRATLAEASEGAVTGDLTFDVVYSPGGPSFFQTVEATVTGQREFLVVTLMLEAPTASGLVFEAMYDGQQLDGTLSIPAGVFGDASSLSCTLQRP